MDSVHEIQTRTWTGIRFRFLLMENVKICLFLYDYNIFIQKLIARVFQDRFNKFMMRHSLTTGAQNLDININ